MSCSEVRVVLWKYSTSKHWTLKQSKDFSSQLRWPWQKHLFKLDLKHTQMFCQVSLINLTAENLVHWIILKKLPSSCNTSKTTRNNISCSRPPKWMWMLLSAQLFKTTSMRELISHWKSIRTASTLKTENLWLFCHSKRILSVLRQKRKSKNWMWRLMREWKVIKGLQIFWKTFLIKPLRLKTSLMTN